ncbi:MAG TPA: sulfatase-like hydrolase/transferase, partial [Tepidisphaeraceae bacterium]|nr:sulfatase-like hydrolase/transferase [Tepidisphaeraceae bacterium]
MTRREWLAGSLIGAAMALPASQALGTWLQQAAEPIDPQLPSRRPNILLIIADDLGYPHTGADGMTVVPTPHIDRLANQGARFTRAFVPSPSCSPSRASILTGQTPNRLGMGGVLSGPLDDQHPRYPDLLKAAGYHVGSTGKGYGPAWLDKD